MESGVYIPRKPRKKVVTYPKLRICSSTHIRDRIVQRSVNDNLIYPAMTKSFVLDNLACQKGKGIDRAMDRLTALLRRFYINNGSNEGWVLQFDIKGYYSSMRHEDARQCFARKLDDQTVSTVTSWLDRQYPNPVGYEPGSQMVQILGISLLDPLDHYIKEVLRERFYLRYMDDGLIFSSRKEQLEKDEEAFSAQLQSVGMCLHPVKTRIFSLSDGIKVLGFTFRLTGTGKVVKILDPQNVKHERKKLLRMANLVKSGAIERQKMDECYKAWKAHAMKGDSHKLLKRMDAYVKELFGGGENETY